MQYEYNTSQDARQTLVKCSVTGRNICAFFIYLLFNRNSLMQSLMLPSLHPSLALSSLGEFAYLIDQYAPCSFCTSARVVPTASTSHHSKWQLSQAHKRSPLLSLSLFARVHAGIDWVEHVERECEPVLSLPLNDLFNFWLDLYIYFFFFLN